MGQCERDGLAHGELVQSGVGASEGPARVCVEGVYPRDGWGAVPGEGGRDCVVYPSVGAWAHLLRWLGRLYGNKDKSARPARATKRGTYDSPDDVVVAREVFGHVECDARALQHGRDVGFGLFDNFFWEKKHVRGDMSRTVDEGAGARAERYIYARGQWTSRTLYGRSLWLRQGGMGRNTT